MRIRIQIVILIFFIFLLSVMKSQIKLLKELEIGFGTDLDECWYITVKEDHIYFSGFNCSLKAAIGRISLSSFSSSVIRIEDKKSVYGRPIVINEMILLPFYNWETDNYFIDVISEAGTILRRKEINHTILGMTLYEYEENLVVITEKHILILDLELNELRRFPLIIDIIEADGEIVEDDCYVGFRTKDNKTGVLRLNIQTGEQTYTLTPINSLREIRIKIDVNDQYVYAAGIYFPSNGLQKFFTYKLSSDLFLLWDTTWYPLRGERGTIGNWVRGICVLDGFLIITAQIPKNKNFDPNMSDAYLGVLLEENGELIYEEGFLFGAQNDINIYALGNDIEKVKDKFVLTGKNIEFWKGKQQWYIRVYELLKTKVEAHNHNKEKEYDIYPDIYPNHFNQYIIIELKDINDNIDVEIYNVLGQKQKFKIYKKIDNKLIITFHDNIPPGVYFVSVGKMIKKIIKIK